MGIQGLTKLLSDNAPACLQATKIDSYFSRKIAFDASLHIYQFMVVVGRQGDQTLTNEAGEVTSHLQGMFYRTARLLEAGIKPIYVFEGKPPYLKALELTERMEKRKLAQKNLEEAKEQMDKEQIEKFSKRTIRVTKEHNEECKRLLQLMGVPTVEAPSEAEAQCAQMCKDGLVYASATEDMDSLTFGTPKLVRHLMAPNSKLEISEFDLQKVLEGLKLSMDQFIEMCIILGCDYCGTIRGIGPVRALQLIQKHGTLENILKSLDLNKYQIPQRYPYNEIRQYFIEPEVTKGSELPELKWGGPDEEGLVQFLVNEKQFNEARVRKQVEKIRQNKEKTNQVRLDNFFKINQNAQNGAQKRKEPADKKQTQNTSRGKKRK